MCSKSKDLKLWAGAVSHIWKLPNFGSFDQIFLIANYAWELMFFAFSFSYTLYRLNFVIIQVLLLENQCAIIDLTLNRDVYNCRHWYDLV